MTLKWCSVCPYPIVPVHGLQCIWSDGFRCTRVDGCNLARFCGSLGMLVVWDERQIPRLSQYRCQTCGKKVDTTWEHWPDGCECNYPDIVISTICPDGALMVAQELAI